MPAYRRIELLYFFYLSINECHRASHPLGLHRISEVRRVREDIRNPSAKLRLHPGEDAWLQVLRNMGEAVCALSAGEEVVGEGSSRLFLVAGETQQRMRPPLARLNNGSAA